MNKRLQQIDELVLASHNQGKVEELVDLLEAYDLVVRSAADLTLDEPEETGTSFSANAELKAVAGMIATRRPTLADDSGLVVEGLDGEPGIYSARWAGEPRDFSKAMQRVINDLTNRFGSFEKANHRASFTSVLCLAWPDGLVEFFEGRVTGRIIDEIRGMKGFGYDPIFIPDGESRTFGEMDAHEKKLLSHRSRAFEAFIAGEPSSVKNLETLGL